MTGEQQYPFVSMNPESKESSRLPCLPITLAVEGRSLEASGLLDTGSTVNVLPYDVGIRLGAVWEQRKKVVRLTGNLAHEPARVLIVTATTGTFSPVRLAFAWTRLDALPVILGQVNFFLEFDVCFYRGRGVFEVKSRPKDLT